MKFKWDPKKAATNLSKHGVSFDEAATALQDEQSLTGDDPDHSLSEARMITFGVSNAGHLLVVSHTERDDHIRSLALDRPPGQKGSSMKKVDPVLDELRPEYRPEDFGPMVRGKYAADMKEASNVVVLYPDIAQAFPNAQAVNRALRELLELAKSSVHLPAQ
jgi:hypothetical protein